MNIIFLSRKHGRPLKMQLTPRLLSILGVGLLVISGLIGTGTYWLSSSLQADEPTLALNSASKQDQEALRAMSARMADMQARMMRIDALGAHLAEGARLKGEEFDFNHKPPMGGPEQAIDMGEPHNKVSSSLFQLNEEMAAREAQLVALDRVLKDRRQQEFSLNNMPVQKGYITSTFGYRSDPMTGRTAFHAGIDFGGSEGSDVFSVADGVVSFAGERTGYGNVVEVDHGGGYVTRYAHARALAVKLGDVVTKDQLIAYMGSTGRSTGTHLHYEVLLNGKQINPATFIRVAAR